MLWILALAAQPDLMVELYRAQAPCYSQTWNKAVPLMACVTAASRPVWTAARATPQEVAVIEAAYERATVEAERFDRGEQAPAEFLERLNAIEAEGLAALGVEKPVITVPDWTLKPSGRAVSRYYPKAARKAKLEGGAVVQCAVSLTGEARDCRVVSETPVGQGFSEAALGLVKLGRFSPIKVNGTPFDGGLIRVPFIFALPKSKTNWDALLTTGVVSFAVSAATGGLGGIAAGFAAGLAAGSAVEATSEPPN